MGLPVQVLSKESAQSLESKVDTLQPTQVQSTTGWGYSKQQEPQAVQRVHLSTQVLSPLATGPDVLEEAGVFVQKSQLGGGSPQLRALAANRVLTMVDGMPLNNLITRVGNSQHVLNANPLLYENVEVSPGPGQVRYGSDAMGGLVAFHSAPLPFKQPGVQGKVRVGFESATQGFAQGAQLTYAQGIYATRISTALQMYGDLRIGSWDPEGPVSEGRHPVRMVDGKLEGQSFEESLIQRGSGYSLGSVQWENGWQFGSHQLLARTLYSSTGEVSRSDRMEQWRSVSPANPDKRFTGPLWQQPAENLKLKPRYEQWTYGPQRWLAQQLNYRAAQLGVADSLNVTAYVQNWQESRLVQNFGAEKIEDQWEEVWVAGGRLEALSFVNPKVDLIYGVDVQGSYLDSKAEVTDPNGNRVDWLASRYPEAGSQQYTAGVWGMTRYHPTERLDFQLGLRGSFVRNLLDNGASALWDRTVEQDFWNLGGRMGFCASAATEDQICGFVGSGFRAPNVDDMGKVFVQNDGSIQVPNTSLEPEKVYSAELSLRTAPRKHVQVEVTPWASYLMDPLVSGPYRLQGNEFVVVDGDSLEVTAIQNLGSATAYGVDARVDLNLNAFLGSKHLVQYSSAEDDQGHALRHAVPLRGQHTLWAAWGKHQSVRLETAVRWDQGKSHSELSLDEQSKTTQYSLNDDGEAYAKSWWVADARVQWKMGQLLQLSAGIDNLFDRNYRTAGSGIHAPGRNVKTALTLSY